MKLTNLLAGILIAANVFCCHTVFAANGETIFGITSGNTLVKFNSETPSVNDFELPITGMQAGEVASAIDFRPANNALYLFSNNDTLYTINVESGVATAVGAALTFSGTKIGIDFNPVVDAIRLVSNSDENARVNANTGVLASTDSALAYDAGDVNNGVSPNVVNAAYANNSVGQGVTTLFGIDSATNSLVLQGSPNGSPASPNSGTLFTIGGLGIDASESVGFDIAESKSGKGLASVVLEGENVAKLYAIDLGGGHATLIGTISAATAVVDIAIHRAGAVRLDQSTYSVNEASGNLSVVVERVGGSSNPVVSGTPVPVTVLINNNGFSATVGQDFLTLANTEVTFAEGEVSKSVQVGILNDLLDEEVETFTLFLSSPTGGVILADTGAATVSILDDDIVPTPTPTPNDNVAPVLTLDVDKKFAKSRFLRRGLAFDASCDTACTTVSTITVSQGIAQRFGLSSRTLVTVSATLSAGVQEDILARAESAIRRRLSSRAGSIPVTLKVVASDASGNTDTETIKIVIQDDIRRRN